MGLKVRWRVPLTSMNPPVPVMALARMVPCSAVLVA